MPSPAPTSAPSGAPKANPEKMPAGRGELIDRIDQLNPLQNREAALRANSPEVIAHFVEKAKREGVIEPFPNGLTLDERGAILESIYPLAEFTDVQEPIMGRVAERLTKGVGEPGDKNPYVKYISTKNEDGDIDVKHKLNMAAIKKDLDALQAQRIAATPAQRVVIDNMISSLNQLRNIDPLTRMKADGVSAVRAGKQEALLRHGGKMVLFVVLVAAGVIGLGASVIHAFKNKGELAYNNYILGLLLAYVVANPSILNGKAKNAALEAGRMTDPKVQNVLNGMRLDPVAEEQAIAPLFEKSNRTALTKFLAQSGGSKGEQARQELLDAMGTKGTPLEQLSLTDLTTLGRAAIHVESEGGKEIASNFLKNRKRQIKPTGTV